MWLPQFAGWRIDKAPEEEAPLDEIVADSGVVAEEVRPETPYVLTRDYIDSLIENIHAGNGKPTDLRLIISKTHTLIDYAEGLEAETQQYVTDTVLDVLETIFDEEASMLGLPYWTDQEIDRGHTTENLATLEQIYEGLQQKMGVPVDTYCLTRMEIQYRLDSLSNSVPTLRPFMVANADILKERLDILDALQTALGEHGLSEYEQLKEDGLKKFYWVLDQSEGMIKDQWQRFEDADAPIEAIDAIASVYDDHQEGFGHFEELFGDYSDHLDEFQAEENETGKPVLTYLHFEPPELGNDINIYSAPLQMIQFHPDSNHKKSF